MPSRGSLEFLSRSGIVPATGRPAPRLAPADLLVALLPAEQPSAELVRSVAGRAPDYVRTQPVPTAEVTDNVEAVQP